MRGDGELQDPDIVGPLLGVDPNRAAAPVADWPQPAWPVDLAGLDDNVDLDPDHDIEVEVDGMIDSSHLWLQEVP